MNTAMDIDEEDDPPQLVVADGGENSAEETLNSKVDNLSLVKVPITIVTGMTSALRCSLSKLEFSTRTSR